MVYRTLGIVNVAGSPADGANIAKNATDNNPATRFSSYGQGAFLTLTLPYIYKVQDIQIAWHTGDKRKSKFQILTSKDYKFYNAHTGLLQSSGTSVALEKYNIPDVSAKIVKIVFDSNTENGWFSVTEVKINGDDFGPPTVNITAPSSGSTITSSTVTIAGTASD